MVAVDLAGTFQRAQPAVAGREAEADSLGEFGGVKRPSFFAVLGAAAAVHRPGDGLADRSADRGARAGPCSQLRRGLHRSGHRCPAGTARTAHGSPCSGPSSGTAMIVIAAVLLAEQLIG